MKFLCWDDNDMCDEDAEEYTRKSARDAAIAFAAWGDEAVDGDEVFVMVVDPDGVRTKFCVTARAVMQYDAEELK